MSSYLSIKSLLNNEKHIDTRVCVRGWVRTRRDSKAGISFVSVSDGSCFDAIQCVVSSDLGNYQDEVLKINTGCCVEISGMCVASQGKGQSVEIQADEVIVHGWGRRPRNLSDVIQASYHGAFA